MDAVPQPAPKGHIVPALKDSSTASSSQRRHLAIVAPLDATTDPQHLRRTRSLSRFQTPRLSMVVAVLATISFAFSWMSPASAQANHLITSDGIAGALVGSTVAQLEAQLGPEWTVTAAGQVLVDIHGYSVSRNGEVVFVAAAATGVDGPAANTPLDVFIVDNPGAATAEGIGVGTTLDTAAAAYGAPTLSYNTANESREFARFERQPDGFFFRTGSGPTAGIYDESNDEFRETSRFRGDAPIQSIWVSCGGARQCPAQPALAYTGGQQQVLLAVSATLIIVGFALVALERRRMSQGQLL